MHLLFEAFAHRYDLHTPPGHYYHDHQLVLDLAAEQRPGCRVLDVGCGTGVLLEKIRRDGFDGYGLDVSRGMIAVARTRVPDDVVRIQRMQELDEIKRYDLIVSMSWTIHYCAGEQELVDVIGRIGRALMPGGRVLLQVAHAPNLHGEWMEDRETGPDGEHQGVSLRFRFRPDEAVAGRLFADYAFTCESRREVLEESHVLECANALLIAGLFQRSGFTNTVIWNSWRRDTALTSGSVFVTAIRS
jgi:SAM-dependent methyltransferase